MGSNVLSSRSATHFYFAFHPEEMLLPVLCFAVFMEVLPSVPFNEVALFYRLFILSSLVVSDQIQK